MKKGNKQNYLGGNNNRKNYNDNRSLPIQQQQSLPGSRRK